MASRRSTIKRFDIQMIGIVSRIQDGTRTITGRMECVKRHFSCSRTNGTARTAVFEGYTALDSSARYPHLEEEHVDADSGELGLETTHGKEYEFLTSLTLVMDHFMEMNEPRKR
tara:strand:- start:61 stop:402 length:342 start_codon:yes stop_codon:yes gene_type:complete